MFNAFYKSFTTKEVTLLFLLFSSLIFYPLPILVDSPKFIYAIVFLVWTGVCFFFVLFRNSIPLILLLALFVLFPSVISGIFLMDNNMTNIVDLLADLTRFIAPVISYVTVIFLLGTVKPHYIFRVFLLLLAYDIFNLFQSLIYKFTDYLFYESPLTQYGGVVASASPLLVMVLMFYVFFMKKTSFLLVLLLILSLSTLIISPIISSSKTNLILMFVNLLTIIYLVYSHMRSKFKKLLVITLILLTIPTTWVLIKDSFVIHRYEQALGTLGVFKTSQTEGSTSARIGEVLGVLDNLSGSWYSALFGMGSGAWITSFYVDEYIKTDKSGISGLGKANYRDNGNYIHHIHSGIFSILNRNGLMGLVFYSYFIYLLIKSSQRLLKLGKHRFRYFTREECFVYSYGLGSVIYLIGGIISTIPSLGFYGNFDWGFQVALIPVAVRYLSDSTHGIPYNFENRTNI